MSNICRVTMNHHTHRCFLDTPLHRTQSGSHNLFYFSRNSLHSHVLSQFEPKKHPQGIVHDIADISRKKIIDFRTVPCNASKEHLLLLECLLSFYRQNSNLSKSEHQANFLTKQFHGPKTYFFLID